MLWFNFILGLNFIFLSFLVWLCMIMNFKQRETKFKLRIKPGGGTLGFSGWGCAAGTLEPLTYTRASSAQFCYPILE